MKTPDILLVTNAAWGEIRTEFDEAEKAALRGAIANQVLCPPGLYLDAHRLTATLAIKLRRLLVARAETKLTASERKPERKSARRSVSEPPGA